MSTRASHICNAAAIVINDSTKAVPEKKQSRKAKHIQGNLRVIFALHDLGQWQAMHYIVMLRGRLHLKASQMTHLLIAYAWADVTQCLFIFVIGQFSCLINEIRGHVLAASKSHLGA